MGPGRDEGESGKNQAGYPKAINHPIRPNDKTLSAKRLRWNIVPHWTQDRQILVGKPVISPPFSKTSKVVVQTCSDGTQRKPSHCDSGRIIRKYKLWLTEFIGGGFEMAKSEKTSKAVASKASKLLKNPKTPPPVKSVAASALTQAADKKPAKSAAKAKALAKTTASAKAAAKAAAPAKAKVPAKAAALAKAKAPTKSKK